MKRFLVVLQGDKDHYISSFIAGEVSKGGESYVNYLINKSSKFTGVVVPYNHGSSMRYVYKIIYGEKREDVLDEDEMRLLYTASIQKYNES